VHCIDLPAITIDNGELRTKVRSDPQGIEQPLGRFQGHGLADVPFKSRNEVGRCAGSLGEFALGPSEDVPRLDNGTDRRRAQRDPV
jgi:hypothetical protein